MQKYAVRDIDENEMIVYTGRERSRTRIKYKNLESNVVSKINAESIHPRREAINQTERAKR